MPACGFRFPDRIHPRLPSRRPTLRRVSVGYGLRFPVLWCYPRRVSAHVFGRRVLTYRRAPYVTGTWRKARGYGFRAIRAEVCSEVDGACALGFEVAAKKVGAEL